MKIIRRGLQIYQPGQVIKARVMKRLNKKMKGTELEFAWQTALAFTLGLMFVAAPLTFNAILSYRASSPSLLQESSPNANRERLHQLVYAQRLQNRRELEEEVMGRQQK